MHGALQVETLGNYCASKFDLNMFKLHFKAMYFNRNLTFSSCSLVTQSDFNHAVAALLLPIQKHMKLCLRNFPIQSYDVLNIPFSEFSL